MSKSPAAGKGADSFDSLEEEKEPWGAPARKKEASSNPCEEERDKSHIHGKL